MGFFFIINIFVTVLLQHLGFKDNFKGILKETSSDNQGGKQLLLEANFPFLQIFHFCNFLFLQIFHLLQLLMSLSSGLCRSLSSVPTLAPGALFFVHRELLLLDRLQLVSEVELCSLLLELGKLVLVLGNLFQCRLDEFSSQIIDGNVQLVNLKASFPICLSASSLALSRSLGCPHLSSITFLLSAAFLSCSFFSSSAAFFRSKSLSFFFLSGVMKPFLFFFPAA